MSQEMDTRQIYFGKYMAGKNTVSSTGGGLVCDCQEHRTKGSDCMHIQQILKSLMANKFGTGFKIMERSSLKLCKFCSSGDIKKWGFRNTKSGKSQIFKCGDCGRKFTTNFGFEKMRTNEVLITRALQMYFAGMSVRNIADCFRQEKINISYRSVYDWVKKYSKMVSTYVDGIVPHVGNWFRADEVWVKINGQQCYLFASMDDDTRFWLASDIADNKFQHNADNLLDMTKKQAGKIPKHFITDKLQAYQNSCNRVFGTKTHHTSNAGIRSKRTGQNFHPSNNKMERLNGAIRDREKVFRGLKSMDTEILNGMRTYYNFIKLHGALNGKTPAEASGIKIDGDNKWKTIIQNASLSQISS